MVFDIKTDLSIQYEYPSGTWNEIVADSFEVNIDRGISVEQGVFARPDVGTATVRMMKKNLGDLVNGPAYKSNQNFQISYRSGSSGFSNIFYGLIQNVSMQYLADSKKLEITITANDFAKVALNTQLSTFSITGTVSNRSFINQMTALSAAIYAVDNRVTIGHNGSGGSSTTQWAWTWLDTPSGEILTQFLDAELGWCFSKATDPQMLYYTRADINTKQATTWSSSRDTVSNIHSTATTHYCMDTIDLSYDSDALVNKVQVTETQTTATATSTNSSSVTAYGEQSGQFEVAYDTGGITNLASWASTVASAANPKSVKGFTSPAVRRDGTVSTLVNKEIGDVMQVEFTDGTNTLQEIYLITRLGHTISADHWEVNVGLWRGI
jgi:hypothetical protein